MAAVSALPDIPLVLDTDVFSNWRKGKQPAIANIYDYVRRFKANPRIPSIVVFEAHNGFESQIVKLGSLDEKMGLMRQMMERLVRECGVLPFDDRAAMIAAQIYTRIPNKKLASDIFIAATAIAHGCGVATANQRDFELIGQYTDHLLYLAIWK